MPFIFMRIKRVLNIHDRRFLTHAPPMRKATAQKGQLIMIFLVYKKIYISIYKNIHFL